MAFKNDNRFVAIMTAVVVTLCALAAGSVILTSQGCSREEKEETPQQKYEITLLFVHEGISVYRFRDGGDNVYFTSTSASWNKTVKHGDESAHEAKLTTSRDLEEEIASEINPKR